jgi:hypothetical protein
MRLAVSVLLALLFLPAGPAHAASGIHPLAPASGDTVVRGESPTFRMRVNGGGSVYVHVCRSARRRDGAICSDAAAGRARRGKGGVATFKPKFYDLPEYFANRAGTYHWQAVRIACHGSDCRQEGPVVRFKVV